ncbi:hypothetical protein [Micromonospora mirobrigensis]|uniref:Uncharacterized protein n=1 Tax=Micromonospora mirobrigensis TaxID=262898 RepID=A0A1C4ZDZ5_9ACTN|nr:hypothetical protein [Micromonospora mirobrigensis]SCF31189.1 hypothetical protein GA0070564_105353 [Micromonospora mirobrigensis]
MRIRGVVYDTGVELLPGRPSRPDFDPDQVRRDLRTIRTELGANAVRLIGRDPARLRTAGTLAAEAGLAVWVSPGLIDVTPAAARAHLAVCAQDAERLRAEGADVVLVAGWEATLFLRGIVAGATAAQRVATLTSPRRLVASTLRHGPFPWALNRHLRRAAATARAHFAGPVTYAALDFETVDWTPFDLVGVDHYRAGQSRPEWAGRIAGWRRPDRPVVLTEMGCATYAGAAQRGATAWTVVDRDADPPRLREPVTRDEAGQAEEVGALLDAAEAAGVEGAFVFSYAAFSYPHRPEPELDLDAAGYGLVAVLPDGRVRRKAAFAAVARRFGGS